MLPHSGNALKALRLGLLLSTLGWGLAFYFTFASWDEAAVSMYGMGAGFVKYSPLLDYWMRMASVVMGCVGVASFLALRKPSTYESVISLLGPFHLIVGMTLLISALKNHLRPEDHPTFIADITFCFVTGCLILIPLTLIKFENRKGS